MATTKTNAYADTYYFDTARPIRPSRSSQTMKPKTVLLHGSGSYRKEFTVGEGNWDIRPYLSGTINYPHTLYRNGIALLCCDSEAQAKNNLRLITGKGGNMLKGILDDLRGFLKENKDTVWTVLFVLAVDQFFFQGAFRDRLKAIVDNFLKKAEKTTPTT